GRRLEPARLPVRPVPALGVQPAVSRGLHPRLSRGRRLHPAAPGREGTPRRLPGPDRLSELLRPNSGGVPAASPAASPAHRDARPPARGKPADRVHPAYHADVDPDRAGYSDAGHHDGQKALSELRDDGQRGQHVLLLLRESVPLKFRLVSGTAIRASYLVVELHVDSVPCVMWFRAGRRMVIELVSQHWFTVVHPPRTVIGRLPQ